MQCTDTTHAVSGIVYLNSRTKEHKWSSEILISDYRGVLRSFLISSTDGYKYNHQFHFEGGISSITFHPCHNMIFVTGLPANNRKESTSAYEYGLRGWRLLNDSPFYKLSYSVDRERPSLRSWLYNPLGKTFQQSVITRAVASPSGSCLACVHLNGSISLWKLPGLDLLKMWPLATQPTYNLKSPLILNGKQKVWPLPENGFSEYSPIDINWWSDDAIIVSRLSGAVSICATADLHNMLRDKPEFLQGHPQITGSFNGGFLSLECEATLVSAKKRRNSNIEDESKSIKGLLQRENITEHSDDDDEEEEEETVSFVSRSSEIIKTALYIITDMERFQPKPKKLHLLSRIYRLLCLKSTTPGDLYSRKIESGEYAEALVLAHTYELDSDLVYQQQWRSSRVSHQSIQEYLSKVSKKIWVIQQCCDRVPETLPAAMELLEFGLTLTNVEILKDLVAAEQEGYVEEQLLSGLTLESLSAQKTEVLRYRNTMFFYLDRLEIYKAVIQSESSSYSTGEYNRLRCNTICRSAIEFAREGRVQALTCLWPHLQDASLHLLVLQNLPETLSPMVYKSLLPKYNNSNETKLEYGKSIRRNMDWSEKDIFSSIWSTNWSDDTALDEPLDGLDLNPPSWNLTEWYSCRAREIERRCGLPHHALALVSVALDSGVPGLEELHSLLLTLNTIVYTVNIEQMTLARLECCSQFQVANYLMSKSSSSNVVGNLKNILFPYMERCEELSCNKSLTKNLFNEYIVQLSTDDLTLPLQILRGVEELGFDTQWCLTMADNCFMAQDSVRQLSLCFDMLDALPKESDGSVSPSNHVQVLDEMNRFLQASSLLHSYGVSITYAELKVLVTNPKEVQSVLVRVSRNASNRRPLLSAEEWNELLIDILELHSKIFCCIDIELCYEIYASSLLSSASKTSIYSTKDILTCDRLHVTGTGKTTTHRIPLLRSVALVLEAAREYFNSASSIADPVLELSWACLQLIKEDIPEVQQEKDLICALQIIQEFELGILPIQVRLYNSKVSLVEECLRCDNKAYTSVDKFIRLAKLLQVAPGDDKKRELLIVSLCAEKALESEDLEEARKLSVRLVQASVGSVAHIGTRAAQRLGADARLADLSLRRQLLSLALLHCEPESIESLLQIKSSVEADLIQTEMNNLVNLANKINVKRVNLQDSIESSDDDFLDALTSPINENKTLSAAMEMYIQRPFLGPSDGTSAQEDWSMGATDHCTDSKIACHTFYSCQHLECHVSCFASEYDKFSFPDAPDKQLVLLQALIRSNLLQDSYDTTSPSLEITEALTQCAAHLLHEDTALFVSQLLCIFNSCQSPNNVSNIVMDVRNKNSVLYFYALMDLLDLQKDSFIVSPVKVVSEALETSERTPEELRSQFQESLMRYKTQYAQLMEEEKLVLQFGGNINIELFKSDSEYRKLTVINVLRASIDGDDYEGRKKLVIQYASKEVDIAIACVSYILRNYTSLGVPESSNLITDAAIVSCLLTDAPTVIERMENDVWDCLEGTDHQGLLLYFTTMNKVDNRHVYSGLSAKDHLKLIKKSKSACADLDYKLLLSSPSRETLESQLLPSLTKDNIGVVAKLLRCLPPSLNFNFSTSHLYRRWLLKYFFDVAENPQSKKWMQQYRECSGYFSKLNKDDILLFCKEIVFGTTGLQKIPPNTRIQIANQTAEYCQHEHSNVDGQQLKPHNIGDIAVSWDAISDEIESWAEFLERLHSDRVTYIIKDCPAQSHTTWRDLEYSRGVRDEILKPLAELLCDNNLSSRNLISLLHLLNDTISVNEILLHVFKDTSLNANTLVSISKRLVDFKKENIEINQEVLDKIKPYSTSALLSSEQRLGLMSLHKIDSDIGGVEMAVQITREIILCNWKKDELGESPELEIGNPMDRSAIFIRLIRNEESWEKLKVLVDLVSMWPSSHCHVNQADNPYCQLIIKLLLDEEKIDENIPLLKLLLKKYKASENDIQWILQNHINNWIGKIWLCLLSQLESSVLKNLISSIIGEIQDMTKYEDHIDDSLLCNILNDGLFSSIVKTIMFPKLAQFLLKHSTGEENSHHCSYDLNQGVEDLLKNSYIAEAGALRLAALGTPCGLRGFSQAIKYHKQ